MITKFPNTISSRKILYRYLFFSYSFLPGHLSLCTDTHFHNLESLILGVQRRFRVKRQHAHSQSLGLVTNYPNYPKPKHITEITCNRDIDHMYIRHHTHCSVESVTKRGAVDHHCLQCVEEVVELSKLEQHTCLSRTSRIGGTVRDCLTHVALRQRNPHCSIHNI